VLNSDKPSEITPSRPVIAWLCLGGFVLTSGFEQKENVKNLQAKAISLGRLLLVLAVVALISQGAAFAVGTADADVSGATDDLVATYTYIKPFALTALAVLMGIAVLKKFWKRIVS